MTRLRERLARQPAGYPFPIGRVLAIYAGVVAAVLLAALDQTIVATAGPRIVSDLGGLSSYSWVFTAYMLASTVTVPIYGRLGDQYGRRPLLLVSIAVFLAGSALCGAAQTMLQLVVFRTLQGLGAGGLLPLALAVVGSIVPPRDRGRYQGLVSGAWGTAAIAGPALGGFIVDNASWRWIFLVNVPVGCAALAAVALTMPRRAERRRHTVDYLGAAVLGAGTAALLLGLVWGGRDYPWGSTHVLGALAVSAALLAVFGAVERRVREPILPLDILRLRNVGASVAAIGLVGMVLFGLISFVPLFVQAVIGTSATSSGVVLTPFMLSAVVSTILTGQWVSRTGRYRGNALLGPVLLGLAVALLWRMDAQTTTGEAARNMVIAGAGMGLMMQTFVLSVQNSVPLRVIGTATGLTQFARAIGGTLGVAVMGAIVNQRLPVGLRGQGELTRRLETRERLELAHALRPAFLAALVACLVLFAIVLVGVREVPLRKGFEEAAEPA